MAIAILDKGSAGLQGRLWSRRAEDWAAVQEATALPLYEAALVRLDIGSDTRLLDVACGAGLFAQMASQRGASVSGVDAAPALVSIAERRVPAGDFHVGEMEALPFDDGVFDVVTGFNAFQYAERPVRALAEAARVLRRGGSVFIATWGRGEDSDAMAYIAAVNSVLPPSPPGPGPFALSEGESLRAIAAETGLTLGAIVDVDVPFIYPNLDAALRGMLSAGPAVRAISVAGEERVRAAVTRAIAPYRLSSGGYRLENRFRYVIAKR